MRFYKNNFPELLNKDKLDLEDFIKVIKHLSNNINFENNIIIKKFKEEFLKLKNKPSRKKLVEIINKIIPKSGTILKEEYWINRGYSIEKAKTKISEIQKERSYFGDPNRNWDQSSISYFIEKCNGDKDLALKLYNEKNNKTKQKKIL